MSEENKNEEILEEKEEIPESDAAEEAADTPDKTEELEAQLQEWKDKYTRLFAEYDNYQKRSKREKDARYADAVADVVAEMLPVSDNLERALATEVESEDAKKVLEGVAMVKKQMSEILSKLEVTEIPAVGEEFDPNLHNAVMHIEDETVADNTIVEEFMKGYIYKGNKVVRHSMVKVAN